MEVGGIQFAPLDVPLERRLQTLAAASWFFLMAFGGFSGLILAIYLVIYTRLWWIVSLYLFWVYVFDWDVSERGGRPSEWVRSWTWWKYVKNYFPSTMERLPWVELDETKNYLFCCFPHGMLAAGCFNAFGSVYGEFKTYFPKHTAHVVTLSQHYSMPFFRELALGLGGISSTSKSIDYVLRYPGGGQVCILLVGGAAESYYCRPGQYKIVLKNRKGFVKLALKNGTPLVPVISFGETDLFDQLDGPWLRCFQEGIRKLIGIAPAIPIGRGFFQYSFGIAPRRKPIHTVVGVPMEVPKIEKPTKEIVDEYHEKFIQHLKDTFEQQKYNYLEKPEETNLIVI